MSNTNLTPPTGNSPSEPKPRAVSGSLKDRIAKFNNPSAAPLVPTHAFGTAGPTAPSSTAGRGLIGNRIPSLDPRTAAMVGGQRKVSENRGLIGNRIPSQSAVPGIGSASSAGGRSNSPAGSIDSSSASGRHPGSSASARTSRSSSPPTSPGGGVPPSLLAATLPETGGPGAMTPSSTRADAGEEVTDFSPPETPNANPELPPSDDDLVRSDLTPNNLPANATATNPMFRDLQSEPAPSISSSMASQYDSKGNGDQTQMLLDVSGVSTPTGTPRAAHRDLEGSLAGSARGEGSVADADDLSKRLEGVDVREDGKDEDEAEERIVDRDPTPEPPKIDDDVKLEQKEDVNMDESIETKEVDDDTQVTTDIATEVADLESETAHGGAEPAAEAPVDSKTNDNPRGALADPDAKIEYTTPIDDSGSKPHISSSSDKRDPNQDDDLDALKQGKLHHADSTSSAQPGAEDHTNVQSPANNLAESPLNQGMLEPQLSSDETKHQGGVAGQKMEDVDNADEVIQPVETRTTDSTENDGGPEVREATPVSIVGGETLGPKGALDGPQKFDVEWLEEGRGQSKAADLDEKEYHFGGGVSGSKGAEDGDQNEGDEVKTKDVEEDAPTATASKIASIDDTTEQEDHEKQETLQSQEDKATILPDALTTELKLEASRPTQIHIEPSPIAQPTNETTETDSSVVEVPDTSDEPTPSVEPSNPPTFPAPPSEDPDVVDPISQIPSGNPSESGVSTPIDPSFVKAFPEVPDEDKPRVEVHVSTPVNTPKKDRSGTVVGESHDDQIDNSDRRASVSNPDSISISNSNPNSTPVADLPGTSKSLSYPDLSRSESGLSESASAAGDEFNTPQGLNKRLSARRSPKSPLLGDEDPGDFTPGEGWAVVTKGREL